MSSIHPSSQISPQARIGRDVEIGPFCIVEAGASIGDGCQIEGRVVVKSGTTLGDENYVAEGAVLGGMPQHKTHAGRPGHLKIGDRNTIREHVTIHRGLASDGETRIGDINLLMVNSHVAHDCVIEDHTILANNVMLAGHVLIESCAYLSGAVGVHQFCRIGCFAMVGGQARITKDVPPFVTVDGGSSLVVGLNIVGLRRGGLERDEIQQLKAAYRLVFRSGARWDDAIAMLREQFPHGRAAKLARFLSETRRGCIQERRVPKHATIKLHDPDESSRHVDRPADQDADRATA